MNMIEWTPNTVRKFREHLGKTQAEMGEMLGVTQGTVSRWETGAQPLLQIACKFLDVLAEQAEWLPDSY
jgi:DNA-binding transcriptional regulator YiaG